MINVLDSVANEKIDGLLINDEVKKPNLEDLLIMLEKVSDKISDTCSNSELHYTLAIFEATKSKVYDEITSSIENATSFDMQNKVSAAIDKYNFITTDCEEKWSNNIKNIHEFVLNTNKYKKTPVFESQDIAYKINNLTQLASTLISYSDEDIRINGLDPFEFLKSKFSVFEDLEKIVDEILQLFFKEFLTHIAEDTIANWNESEEKKKIIVKEVANKKGLCGCGSDCVLF